MNGPARRLGLAQEASKRQNVHKEANVRRQPLHITTTRIFDIDATVLLNDAGEATGKLSYRLACTLQQRQYISKSLSPRTLTINRSWV
jgi:hypothetical protein